MTGGYIYRGTQGTLASGTYIYGDFCSGEIFAWNGTTPSVLLAAEMSISSFGEDEDGELYVVNLGGSVSRLSQAAVCEYAITPTSASFGPAGGTGTINVSAGAGCTWTAHSNASWSTITGFTGSGHGTVTYSVDPYSGKPKKRNGTLTVAGQTVRIQQTR